MKAAIRKSLIAGAITAMMSVPAWAGDMGDQSGARGATGSSGAYSSTQSASSSLYSLTPQELRRMDVVDASGEDIGNVSSVVRSRDQENIQLVISSGFLGSGKTVAVPLDEVSLMGDKIQLNASRADLEGRPEYQQEQFVELQPADQPISDFAAFEPLPGEGQSGHMSNQPGQGAPWSSDPTRTDPTDNETSGAPWIVPRNQTPIQPDR